MLAALENGVKGGKWFSLIDKVYRAETLKATWQKVEASARTSGMDGQSVKRFAARAEIDIVDSTGSRFLNPSFQDGLLFPAFSYSGMSACIKNPLGVSLVSLSVHGVIVLQGTQS
jgi:hypothetical protein